VNVSSLGQHPLDFDDVMLTHGYTCRRVAAAWQEQFIYAIKSKLYMHPRLRGSAE
jgi:hypothetical protein